MLQGFTEEALGRSTIPFLGHQNIDHVTVLIHCPPKIVDLATDLDKDCVHKLDITKSAPFPSQRASKGRAELATPVANCLIGDCDSTLSQKIFHVSQA